MRIINLPFLRMFLALVLRTSACTRFHRGACVRSVSCLYKVRIMCIVDSKQLNNICHLFCLEPCPKCEHPRAYFMQIQTRSADEPMTTFYKCCSLQCGHRWRDWDWWRHLPDRDWSTLFVHFIFQKSFFLHWILIKQLISELQRIDPKNVHDFRSRVGKAAL